ncbi:CaiB/BaiF CoA transferase family protein [Microbacterium stercoris]|uniref:CoA transferase n=1 Tax=Microbacterium stercoris TaxID=2820289 RepID=A0A939TP10_9MICO|nr:CoA transferase [Microbacterium stercoris]MBO3661905.1 CoA transferase [Microbacterium stercoris]
MTTPPEGGPLAGVVVADLSRVLAGPYCTMMLGDLGATVIKVESPQGDETRTWVPPERDGSGTYFLSVNRDKQSIALDFSAPDDLALVRRIVDRADVVVQNFKPGGLVRFGLDYETLSAARPELVYASISGFGSTGGADLPGYDLLAQAVSGMMSVTGSPDGEPTKVGVAVFDVIAGLHAVTGILAALRARDLTGRGDHVEVNLLSSALSGLVNQASAYVAGGVEPGRLGNAHPSLYPYEPFPARDREIVIAVGNDAQFARLADAVGLEPDPSWATMRGRNLARADVRAALIERLAARDADEWFAVLRAAGVPAAPILSIGGGVALAEELGLAPVTLAGDVPTIRHPIGFANATLPDPVAPPALDADRAAVLEWLGEQ